jgi:DNA (cytosine-5)-methyltransferase 1
MRSIELFAGIGGIALAAEWAGIETVAFCEREPFCQKVLNKHWPDVPIFDDVRTLNRKTLEEKGVIEPGGTVDIISGGWPCQPYSIAGKKKGDADERALWKEMFRLVGELKPRWVIGENVANFSKLGLDNTLDDLEGIGYTTQSFIIPAAAVGAIHKRERVFVVAYSHSEHVQRESEKQVQRESDLQREFPYGSPTEWRRRSSEFEPKLCRSLNGFPNGVDRLRALGNAVVPQQIYPIFKYIMEIERGLTHE